MHWTEAAAWQRRKLTSSISSRSLGPYWLRSSLLRRTRAASFKASFKALDGLWTLNLPFDTSTDSISLLQVADQQLYLTSRGEASAAVFMFVPNRCSISQKNNSRPLCCSVHRDQHYQCPLEIRIPSASYHCQEKYAGNPRSSRLTSPTSLQAVT
jgi:hypothetical protein